MAPLLRSGNPLRSEQNFNQEPHHSETEAKDHSPKLSTQSLATSEVNRKAKVSNVEAKNSFLWTLILSLSWLTEGSLQAAYRISLAYSGPTDSFNNNYGGAVLQHSSGVSYYLYNNFDLAPDSTGYLVRAFSSTGTLLGSVDSQVASAEGVVKPVADKIAVLGKDTGVKVITLQTKNFPTSVAFSIDAAKSTSTGHNLRYAGAVSVPVSGIVLAYSSPNTNAIFYRVDINDVLNPTSYTLDSSHLMLFVNQIVTADGGILTAVGRSNLVTLSYTDMTLLTVHQYTDLGSAIALEPTNRLMAYTSTFARVPEQLHKVDLSIATWTNYETPIDLVGYATNMLRLPNFPVLLVTEKGSLYAKLFKTSPFSLFASTLMSNSLNQNSLRIGHSVGHHTYVSATSLSTKQFHLFDVQSKFVQVTRVLTSCSDTNCNTCSTDPTYCTDCNSGFFLRDPADGKCYKNDIVGYGLTTVSGITKTTKCADAQCSDCYAAYSECLQCATAYYLKEGTTSICYTNTLTGFGLKTASPQNVLAACTPTFCKTCTAYYTYCTDCNVGYYLRQPTDGKCYKNDVSGYGLITVSGVTKTTKCSDTQCSDCLSSYTTCLKCNSPYYLKDGTNSTCYTNTLTGFGLKTASPQNV